MSTHDRRSLERFALDCVAIVTVWGRYGEETEETRVRDISASGAYVYLDRSPEVGTHLEVELHLVIGALPEILSLPEDVRVRVRGRVVRNNHWGAGVAFEQPLRFSPPNGCPDDDNRADDEPVSADDVMPECGNPVEHEEIENGSTPEASRLHVSQLNDKAPEVHMHLRGLGRV